MLKSKKQTLRKLEFDKKYDEKEYEDLNRKIIENDLLYSSVVDYDDDQIDALIEAKKSSINENCFHIIANPKLNSEQMRKVLNFAIEGERMTFLRAIAKPEINAPLMDKLRIALEKGMSMTQVKSAMPVNFDWDDVVDIKEWDALLTPDDKYQEYEENIDEVKEVMNNTHQMGV